MPARQRPSKGILPGACVFNDSICLPSTKQEWAGLSLHQEEAIAVLILGFGSNKGRKVIRDKGLRLDPAC